MQATHRASKYDLEEIEQSGLFDIDFYLKQAPEAANFAAGVAAHYLEKGALSGLAPHWLFDPAYYLHCNYLRGNADDVSYAMNPLLHFIRSGADSGRNPHPLFDVAFYLRKYPEVAKCGINPLLHYVRIGFLEGADPHPLFDTAFYVEQEQTAIELNENPLFYFLSQSSRSLANPHPLFDVSFYRRMNPEVLELQVNPLLHYVTFGAMNRRDPHILFDSSFYLEQLSTLSGTVTNPLVHFLEQTAGNGANPHALFDSSFYLKLYPDVKGEDMNPLCHYLRYGAAENKDPSPFFDTDYYLTHNPAARKSGQNPLKHYLLEGAGAGYDPSPLFDSRFYQRRYLEPQPLSVESAAAPKALDLELEPLHIANPLIHYARRGRFEELVTRSSEPGSAVPHANSPPLFPFDLDGEQNRDNTIESNRSKLLDELARPCKHLFLMGCLMRGGAERSAAHCVQFLAQNHPAEDILVVVTDVSLITCADWLPANVRLVNLAEVYPKQSQYDRGALLMRIIGDTRAEMVHVFNSPRAYAAIGYYFDFYPRPNAKILSYLCGYELYTEYNFNGFEDGAMYYAAPHLDLMITDNARLCNTIIERFAHVPSIEEKAVTCYQPLMASLREELSSNSSSGSSSTSSERSIASQKVLWASRIDETKRPDILARVAQGLPDVKFEVFGYSSSGYDYDYLRKPNNITLMGEYSDFGQIPKQDKAVFLYTSDADGMPNVLLEAMASGIPVVAPNVGGIGELIAGDTGWLISKFDDVDQYVRSLKHVLSHPEDAKARAANARDLLSRRHCWSSFSKRLNELGIV